MNDFRKEIKNLRREFDLGQLSENDLPNDPMVLLKAYLNNALDNNIKDANAFVLSTVSDSQPDSRVLLIRDIVNREFHFYSNYGSKKAMDISNNPKAAVNIFWPELDRQIRMKVNVSKLDPELSDQYFSSRPRKSQIGAWASKQSQLLNCREDLDQRMKRLEEQFDGQEVPRPEFWGGYKAEIDTIEFWQGRPSRLHDRLIYEWKEDSWEIARLYP